MNPAPRRSVRPPRAFSDPKIKPDLRNEEEKGSEENCYPHALSRSLGTEARGLPGRAAASYGVVVRC